MNAHQTSYYTSVNRASQGNYPQKVRPNTKSSPEATACLTEIVLTGFGSSIDMVMPMLASVSQQCSSKWLTWIGKGAPHKALVYRYNVNTSRLRTIQIEHNDEMLWCLWECLTNGTSNTVVACIDDLKEADRKKLEQACAIGNTNAIILRQRASN